MTVPDRNVYAYGSIPSRTKSCTIKCYVAMAGDASHAAQCPTLKSITKSFVAIPAMIRSIT